MRIIRIKLLATMNTLGNQAPPPVPAAPAAPRRRVSSQELLGTAREIEIVHGSQCYRLRLTSLGKLILTK
jgi:hemin uptake protein HemP